MEEAEIIVVSYLADYKPSDEAVALSLESFNGESFSANFVVGPVTNVPPMSFQIFFDQLWNPMFIMSDSPRLESWVTVIGRTLENTPEANLLSSLLPLVTRSLEKHLAPPKPVKAAEEVEEIAFTPEQVEREIRAWSRAHPRMRLSLNRVDHNEHIALFNLGHIRVQLYFKSNWHPLFFSTENSELNQHLVMANMLISNHGYIKRAPAAAAAKEPETAPVAPALPADAQPPVSEPSDSQMEIDAAEPSSEPQTEAVGTSETKSEPVEAELGLARLFDLIMEGYKSQYAFDMEADDMEDDEDENDEKTENTEDATPADPREPTAEEWTTIVIPGIKRYMHREGMAQYLIDEWLRRVDQTKTNSSTFKALSLIRDELLNGGTIPKSLRPFVPRHSYGGYGANFDATSNEMTGVASELADVQSFLSAQWTKLSRRLTPDTGFYARPLKGDLLHWTLSLFGYDANSPLGIALMELALQHHSFDDAKPSETASDTTSSPASYYAPKKKVEATNITIEVLFPESFAEDDAVPEFRIIRPSLIDLPPGFFENVFKTFKPKPKSESETNSEKKSEKMEGVVDLADSASDVSQIRPSYYAALSTSSSGVTSGADSELTVTTESTLTSSVGVSAAPMAVDPVSEPSSEAASSVDDKRTAWARKDLDLFDFFADLRLCLLTQNPKVDMNSALTGYQTTGFWKRFRCISAVLAEEEKIEGTGKVCLPASCLEMIYGGRVSVSLSMSGNLAPMTFELRGVESKVQTYCGVLEFTAQEGTVVVPSWMFQMLHFQEGETVMLRQITLPPGDFVKLQPLTDSYAVEGINPKTLLEWRLRDFVALTKGEILPIISHGHTFRFSVLDVRPGHAIAITDRDITVEFVDPLETTSENDNSNGKPSVVPNASSAPSSEQTPAAPIKTPLKTGHVEGEEVVNGKKCETCRHMIPEAAFLTHSMRCPRMNYFCEACQIAVPKADKENHDAVNHTIVECGRCRATMESRLLHNHAQNLCKARIVKCAYCELTMPAESKENHENMCGARTVKCSSCNSRVSLRFLEEHQASGCVRKEEPRRYGSPSAREPTSAVNSQIFVCDTCKAPIDSFDELQVHMLTVHYSESEPTADSDKNAMDSDSPKVTEEGSS